MHTVIFWFRKDLRLHDQRALDAALKLAPDRLLPVYVRPPADAVSPWVFPRSGPHRQAWQQSGVDALARQLAALGCPLIECVGDAPLRLMQIARAVGARTIVCEAHAAPEEVAEEARLRASLLEIGGELHTVWQTTLFDPAQLPWPATRLPSTFTAFRHGIEGAGVQPDAPRPEPKTLPPWPGQAHELPPEILAPRAFHPSDRDPRSSLPLGCAADSGADGAEAGGEAAAKAHLARYLARGLPHSYKATRDALTGVDFSSKCSPWFATGALSPRLFMAELRRFEAKSGTSEGSYWLWFEMLWRDYFRFLHCQYGQRLYRASGLASFSPPTHDAAAFAAWCAGQTGNALVDAGMRELAATGFLSNRMRQIVASYLIHDLGGDWRAGAAWFESRLIDFDVYSNQGNWLYIAGRGTDPRGGRRFNPARQAEIHDADGSYRRQWGTLT